jgi:SAM-dependent methyltransferase
VGFDLSEAVEAAYKNSKSLPNAHIVQADIYNPPFNPEFDFVYSIGVLHHLPDTEKAFQVLHSLLKPRGYLFVWVYGEEANFLATHILEALRKVSTRLPMKLLHALSFPIGVALHLATKIYEYLNSTLVLKEVAERLPSRDYFLQIASYDIRIKCSIAFDLLSAPISKYFTKQEVEQWFTNAGLKDMKITWRNRNSWRGIGRKPS